MTGYAWDGSAWREAGETYVWDGSAWRLVIAGWTWDGSAWRIWKREDITRQVSESVAASESASIAIYIALTVGESAGTSEAWGQTPEDRNVAKAIAEAVTAAEALDVAQYAELAAVAESASLGGTGFGLTEESRNVARAIAEAVSAAEADALKGLLELASPESSSVSGTFSRTQQPRSASQSPIQESVAASESSSVVAVAAVSASEAASLGGAGFVLTKEDRVPATPTGLSASTGTTGIDLSWDAISNADYYDFHVQMNGDPDPSTSDPADHTVAAPATSDTWEDGVGGASYRFRIRARNTAGSSDWSGWTDYTFYPL